MFSSLKVRGYRSISDSGTLPLGPITVVVGMNNSGKSALLRSIYHFQEPTTFHAEDVRIGDSAASVELTFDELPPQVLSAAGRKLPAHEGSLVWKGASTGSNIIVRFQKEQLTETGITSITHKEPDSLILPVLAGRRVNYYREQASRDNAVTVMPQDSNLVSRIMPLVGSATPEGIKFTKLCKEILHANLKVLPGDNNQQFLGVQVDLRTSIPLESMGAGLSGALSLLVGLSQARGKLFLIEEPEDDLHPGALKKLLDAIIESSQHNQFLISTHSSIVLTRLGAVSGTVVIKVTSDQDLPPTSSFAVKSTAEDRLEILRDLGYGLADMSLGEGWIFFEESTAERLVYQWLAPWFAPGLLRLRHISARGNERVRALMTDFKEMFLFAHLEPMYRHRAWVILDGDERSLEILDKLRADFSGWPHGRFRHWEREAIEYYYPRQYAARYANEISAIKDDRKRQHAKQELFKELMNWIEEDPDRAREQFKQSAKDMIAVLRDIENDLINLPT